MPPFDLTRDELIFFAIVLTLVVLPSQLSAIGNAVGRLLRGRQERR